MKDLKIAILQLKDEVASKDDIRRLEKEVLQLKNWFIGLLLYLVSTNPSLYDKIQSWFK